MPSSQQSLSLGYQPVATHFVQLWQSRIKKFHIYFNPMTVLPFPGPTLNTWTYFDFKSNSYETIITKCTFTEKLS